MNDTADQKPGAIRALEQMKDTGERLLPAVDAYLQSITEDPRPTVRVGAYYMTFDGSLVHVSRVREQCGCPVCSGRRRPGQPFITQMLGMTPFGAVFGQVQEEEDDAPHEGPEIKEYVVVVLRGGHGQEGLPGQRPGEAYFVDDRGLFNMLKEEDTSVSDQKLALIGLSLRHEVKMTMERAE